MKDNGELRSQTIHEISTLRKARKAVILAHYYQPPEIQDIADFVGDSLQLAQQAAQTEAEVIVFCGVHFMAESAAILSPDKIVLLPARTAGCPMADMADADQLRKEKADNPDLQIICYVNSSAEVKAESDICCTSSNAEKIVKSLPEGEILFVPDCNLGRYTSVKTGRDMRLWQGYCPTHHNLKKTDIQKQKQAHPEAKVLVHPECREEVWREADYVGSTAGIIDYVKHADADEFIIATEEGIIHELKNTCPANNYYVASEQMVCHDMKRIKLEDIRNSLQNLEPCIQVAESTRKKAVRTLERMLEASK